MKCAVKLNKEKRIKQESTKQATTFLLIAFATYLGDKRGWKPERIFEALKWVKKFAEMILEDYTTLQEAEEALFEDYGLEITEEGVVNLYKRPSNENKTA